jgi:hypothetical protein
MIVLTDNNMKQFLMVRIIKMSEDIGNVWRCALAVICWSGLVGCTTGPERSRPDKKLYPEDTPEQVSLTPAEVKAAITPANAFYLSARERKLCAKRAAEGDYAAARKLAWFYATNHEGRERTRHDDEKYDYWKRVAARLARAKERKAEGVNP